MRMSIGRIRCSGGGKKEGYGFNLEEHRKDKAFRRRNKGRIRLFGGGRTKDGYDF